MIARPTYVIGEQINIQILDPSLKKKRGTDPAEVISIAIAIGKKRFLKA
jgi:hypothetical protein